MAERRRRWLIERHQLGALASLRPIVCGSLSPPPASPGSLHGAGTLSSRRVRATFSVRPPLAKRP